MEENCQKKVKKKMKLNMKKKKEMNYFLFSVEMKKNNTKIEKEKNLNH